MANKNSQSQATSSSIESATTAFKNVSLHEHHPSLRAANSYPLPSSAPHRGGRAGLAGRRLKPGFKLSDIDGAGIPTPKGGGAGGAGLGAGRPPLASDPPKRPSTFVTPFSSFGKVV
jgi:mitogen-activated protein kinase kinase